MSRRTLVTFVSWRDPHHHTAHDDGRTHGPVLALLAERRFDRVILLSRPHRHEHAERTRAAVHEAHPELAIEVRPVEIPDSTHHPQILVELRKVWAAIQAGAPDDDFSVSLLAGTPEIHACWLLLHVAGECRARLLNHRRSSHNGLAGPRLLREVDWEAPLATISPESLRLLSGRAAHDADPSLQDPASTVPRHFFSRRTLDQAVQLARHRTPVMISGEPGTQKHYLAALLHQIGPHYSGPLVIFNCATLPETLFDSVIFGDPGDETSGKLRAAEDGTLVLLKVQRVPGSVLLRLVKAIDDGYYYAAHSSRPTKIKVRLIGTTDVDLDDEVRRGRFPAEAWQRFQASHVWLPPLRERVADIAPLVHEELERANRGLPRPKRLSPAALSKLENHRWPANVSELQRVVEQAVLNAEAPTIQPDDIELGLGVNLANVFTPAAPRLRAGFSLGAYLRAVKQGVIRSALAKTDGNQSEAARLLGLTPQAVSKLLRAVKNPRRPRSSRKKS